MEDYIALNPAEWERYGRGRNFGFFATAEEIREFLLAGLPAAYGPYSLVWYESVKEEGSKYYVQSPRFGEIGDLTEYADSPGWSTYIRSHELTPELHVKQGDWLSAIFSLGGLIDLRIGPWGDRVYSSSDIGMVDKIVNKVTEEGLEYVAYRQIYNALKRHINKHLIYRVFNRDENGEEYEEDVRATEGMIRLFQQYQLEGVTYKLK